MAVSQETQKVNLLLDEMRARLESLERSGGTNQLSFSSVDVQAGRGYIPFFDGEVEKLRIGRQEDGSIVPISKNAERPPVKPLDPVLEPTIAGITVHCNGFTETQYMDFSHVNIYCNDVVVGTIIKVPGLFPVTPLDYAAYNFKLSSVNLSGEESEFTNVVSATPNQVVGGDILDGIISELKLANDAVTNAKLAANAVTETKIDDESISTPKIIAQAITTALIATGAVNADKIAANSVTAEKIFALAVTADKIAANAVTAGKIEAGAVTAQKLAAQIVLATTAFISGDPVGARLVMDSTGITQYAADGSLLLSLGASAAGNTFTVMGTDGNVKATLDSSGVASLSGVNVNDPEKDNFLINGESFYDFVDALPKGIIGRAVFNNLSGSTTTEVGLMELKVQVEPDRFYEISTNTLINTTSAPAILYIKYTTNNTRPTLVSAGLEHSGRAPSGGTPMRISTTFNTGSGSPFYLWLLTSVTAPDGGTVNFSSGNSALGFQLIVRDLGKAMPNTGGPANGSGTDTAPTQQYVTSYPATFNTIFSATPGADVLYQGGAGNDTSIIGFNSAQIVSDLSGATVSKVELFLSNRQTSLEAGVRTIIGTHNFLTPPGTKPNLGNGQGLVERVMTRGGSSWFNIPSSAARSGGPTVNIWSGLQTGAIRGFALDASNKSTTDGAYYGTFQPIAAGASYAPKIRITYMK